MLHHTIISKWLHPELSRYQAEGILLVGAGRQASGHIPKQMPSLLTLPILSLHFPFPFQFLTMPENSRVMGFTLPCQRQKYQDIP